MKMTTKGQYAIVALTHMMKRKEQGETAPIKLADIAATEKLSIHYLEQLFRKLRIAGIVRSLRGPGGGYVFKAERISYKMVLEAVGEKLSFRESLDDKSAASNDVVNNLNGAYKKLSEYLEGLTI